MSEHQSERFFKSMKNTEIAEIFDRIADIMEFKGEMVFKIASYRRAARTLRDTPEDIAVVMKEERLSELSGIGKSMAEKIEEYLKTGKIKKYEEECRQFSEEFLLMLQIPGMGPKSLALIHAKLHIATIEELKTACLDGRLSQLRGLGMKKVENILKGIEFLSQASQRIPLGVALPVAEEILAEIRKFKSVRQAELAGSLRRMRETIGDIDILVASSDPEAAIRSFTHMPQVKRILAAGTTKASVLVEGNQQIDIRVVNEESFGAALLYFTGSKPHNIKLRDLAKGSGLKINEYGIFRGDEKIGGREEKDVYAAVGLAWIPPEMREDRGEIEAAKENALPHLVTRKQIRGDLHVHSNFSDSSATLEQLAEKAAALGYEYIAVTDHSQSLKIAHGLTAEQVAEKLEQIREINKKLKGLKLLLGTEADILSTGKIDYPDDILEKFDWVVASIHSGFKQPSEKITQRIVSAIEHPLVDCIAHPTGRQIGKRSPYQVDLEKIIQKAAETQTAIEINANYDRLDLDDLWCRRAKKLGVRLAIGTDAHRLAHMDMMRLGVSVARRGWLEPVDVLNTMPLEKLRRKRTMLVRS